MATPYNFEAKKAASSHDSSRKDKLSSMPSDNMNNRNSEYRTRDNSWCVCGRSAVMSTAIKCLCCKEIVSVCAKLESFPPSIVQGDSITVVQRWIKA